jgi:hypothetical protein
MMMKNNQTTESRIILWCHILFSRKHDRDNNHCPLEILESPDLLKEFYNTGIKIRDFYYRWIPRRYRSYWLNKIFLLPWRRMLRIQSSHSRVIYNANINRYGVQYDNHFLGEQRETVSKKRYSFVPDIRLLKQHLFEFEAKLAGLRQELML